MSEATVRIPNQQASNPNAPQPTIPLPRGPVPQAPPAPELRSIEVKIDGKPVSVPEGSTILDAAKQIGIDTPTLCYLESLTPVNVCRVCVVELEGSRTLVPACSRKVEPNMSIKTDSERVRLSRKLVLEFLASSVDLSTAPAMQEYIERYDADPKRFGDEPGHGREAGKNRQRPLRPRLFQMRSLLQVRGSLRRGCTKYFCHCRGRAWLLRSYRHGI